MNYSAPIHNAIALDIARKIVSGSYSVGTRISGRSLMSGNYNVSPETVRKAIALLRDSHVLTVSQGKEAVVESVEQAYSFISRNEDIQFVFSMRQEVEALMAQRLEIDKRLESILSEVINYCDRLRNLSPYNPIEVLVLPTSHAVGKTVGELEFRDRFGGALLAIKRGAETIVSPPHNEVLRANDTLVLVGKGELLHVLREFLNSRP